MSWKRLAANERSALGAFVGVVVLSLAFRFPALLNAAATNSDAAVVGLQAMHILRGEVSAHLFGSGYQTSSDSLVAAAFFALGGASPLALMLSSLSLHVASTVLVLRVLYRYLPIASAATLALALVFTTSCLHSYSLYPPRQLSLTLAIAAIALIDHARSNVRLALGACVAGLACAADPYARVFLPGIAVLAATELHRSTRRLHFTAATACGALAGALPVVWLARHPDSTHGVEQLGFDVWAHNVELLTRECLPWAMGGAVYAPVHWMDYARIEVGPMARAVQIAGMLSVTVCLALAVIALVVRRFKDAESGLATSAMVTILATFAGFALSRMVMDKFSMRYLAAIPLVVPLALVPLARRIGPRWTAFAFVPYLAATALGGWIGFGPYVRGGAPVLTSSGAAVDEARLTRELLARGVDAALADYWSAYRLTFLARESVAFVPLHEAQDRIPALRARVASAHRFAYVYDDLRSFEDHAATLAAMPANERAIQVGDAIDIGAFHAVVYERLDVRP